MPRVSDEHSAAQLKCLYRIALTEVIRNTGIGRDFYLHGPAFVTTGLARFIEHAQAAGIVREDDSRNLASHLMALLRADLDLSDRSPPASLDERSRPRGNASRAIEMFCAGIQMEASNAYAVL